MTICVVCEKTFEPSGFAVCEPCYAALERERWQMNVDTTLKHKEYDAEVVRSNREGSCANLRCCKPIHARRLCRSHYESMMRSKYAKAKAEQRKKRYQEKKQEKQIARETINADELWSFVVKTLREEGHEIGNRL